MLPCSKCTKEARRISSYRTESVYDKRKRKTISEQSHVVGMRHQKGRGTTEMQQLAAPTNPAIASFRPHDATFQRRLRISTSPLCSRTGSLFASHAFTTCLSIRHIHHLAWVSLSFVSSLLLIFRKWAFCFGFHGRQCPLNSSPRRTRSSRRSTRNPPRRRNNSTELRDRSPDIRGPWIAFAVEVGGLAGNPSVLHQSAWLVFMVAFVPKLGKAKACKLFGGFRSSCRGAMTHE